MRSLLTNLLLRIINMKTSSEKTAQAAKTAKSKTPRVLVFSGYGLNCEEETKHAFELAGAKANPSLDLGNT